MGGKLGKYGDAKRKVQIPKTGQRGQAGRKELCTLCTNVPEILCIKCQDLTRNSSGLLMY
jgi:hypothetical protein